MRSVATRIEALEQRYTPGHTVDVGCAATIMPLIERAQAARAASAALTPPQLPLEKPDATELVMVGTGDTGEQARAWKRQQEEERQEPDKLKDFKHDPGRQLEYVYT